MVEPSVHQFGAPARRPVGRLGLVALLALGVVALAAMTQAGAGDRAEPAADHDNRAAADDPADQPPRSHLAFGSVTAQGAIVFRLGDAVHAWSVDADGAVRWQHDLADGESLTCGPCPAAVIGQADGHAVGFSPDGTATPAPDGLDGALVPTTSISGVVLAARRPGDRTEFLVPTTAGLRSAGSLVDARLTGPLVVVTPATDGQAVTVMRPLADPLRQAEFEVVHVTPSGARTFAVALDEPGSRPLPCAAGDGATVAYLQLHQGPTSAGSTHVVVRTDDGAPVEVTVTGSFDACAAGPAGVLLATAVTGADGDLSRTVVEVVWLDASLGERSRRSVPVAGPDASIALDPISARAAVAGGPGPSVLLDGSAVVERAPATAVAFDDRGGLWSVDDSLEVHHEVSP